MRILLALLSASLLVAGRPAEVGTTIAAAARRQVGVMRNYDPAYVILRYPGGDVPLDRGVCSDVVIRAFRAAGIDLQREVHEDMKANFASYPRMWGLSAPDPNIDHRRVPNLMTFFGRCGKAVAGEFRTGDIVAWRLPGGLYHIGVIAADRTADGVRPMVIHNIGNGAQEEDVLYAYVVIGHYRW